MAFKITYKFTTPSSYSSEIDETIEEYEEYDYYPKDEDLIDALADELYETYYGKSSLSKDLNNVLVVKQGLRNFIEDCDIAEDLASNYKDELSCHFYDMAREEYERWK